MISLASIWQSRLRMLRGDNIHDYVSNSYSTQLDQLKHLEYSISYHSYQIDAWLVHCTAPMSFCARAGRRVFSAPVGGPRQCAAVRLVGSERRRHSPRRRPAHAGWPLRAGLREARRACAQLN